MAAKKREGQKQEKKLENCAKCGSDNLVTEKEDSHFPGGIVEKWVRCLNCGNKNSVTGDSYIEAEERWNKEQRELKARAV
jgi:C4-type Zn-finger protein